MSAFGVINTTAVVGSVSNTPRCELTTTVDQSAAGYVKFGAGFGSEVYKTNAEMHTAGLPNNLNGATPCLGAMYVVGCALLITTTAAPMIAPSIESAGTSDVISVWQALDGTVKDATYYPTWLTFETDWVLTAEDQSFAIYLNVANTTVKAGSRFWIYRVA